MVRSSKDLGGSPPPAAYRATGASLAVAVLAVATFVAIMALHGLRGEIDPVRQVMSEYANGSHGRVMSVVFYGFGLSSLALAVRLRHGIGTLRPIFLVPLLLAAAGLALIASGLFEVERPLVPDTVEEVLHSYASIAAFVLLVSAMTAVSLACRTDPRWWSFRWVSAGLTSVAAVAALLTPLSAGTGWSGAVQRLLGLTVLLWTLLTAQHVRSRAFHRS